MDKLKNTNLISLNFNLREPYGNKCTNIYAVVKIDGKQIKIPTSLKINSWQWDKKKQTPIIYNNMTIEDRKNAIHVFNKIYDIKLAFHNNFVYNCNITNLKKLIYNLNIDAMRNMHEHSLANLQKGNKGRKKATSLLTEAFNIYYHEQHTRIKKSTIDQQGTRLNAFFAYCKEIGDDKKSMLSQEGLNTYRDYLLRNSKEKAEQGAKRYDSNKSINEKCELIAMLINKVMISHSSFLKYKIPSVSYAPLEEVHQKGDEKKRRPLSQEEIDKLRNCKDLTDEEKEYRDLFLLECNGSYRVSDTSKLFSKEGHEIYHKGKYDLMVIKTEKEGILSVIWMNDIIKDILNRYENGFNYADPTSKGYATKYNRRIKKIAKKAGLDSIKKWTDQHWKENSELLHDIIASHFARYTFIYNGLFKIGFTPEELKDFTGHRDDRMINECYKLETAEDKINNAVKALDRVEREKGGVAREKITRHSINEHAELIQEAKDALCYLGADYADYGHINDHHTLTEMLYLDKHNEYMQMGCDMKYIKELYLNKELGLRERRELLQKHVNEVKNRREHVLVAEPIKIV